MSTTHTLPRWGLDLACDDWPVSLCFGWTHSFSHVRLILRFADKFMMCIHLDI